MNHRTRLYLWLVLATGLLLVWLVRLPPESVGSLARVEEAFADWLTVNAPRTPPAAPLVLVQVTDEDLASSPWPWSPLDYSLFLNAARQFGARVVALEPVLDWPEADPQQLAMLQHQLARSSRVLLGAELGGSKTSAAPLLPQELPVLGKVEAGDITAIPEYPGILRQPMEELRRAGSIGFVNLPAETVRQPIRRVPLLFRCQGKLVSSWVLQGAMLWLGVAPQEVTLFPGSHLDLGGKLRVPVDARGTMRVDFAVPLTRLSMGELLLSAEQSAAGGKTIAPVEQMKNALTLLARTDREAAVLPLANGREGSSGELFAAALATLQTGSFVEGNMGQVVRMIIESLILMEALVLAYYFATASRFRCGVTALFVVAAYLLLSLGLFAGWMIVMPLALPAGLLGVMLAGRGVIWQGYREADASLDSK